MVNNIFVSARRAGDQWVWKYEISIGQPRSVTHRTLGRVEVVPVSEERKIYFGTYWSRMTSYLVPDQGISLGWTYEDAEGVERCDLTDLRR